MIDKPRPLSVIDNTEVYGLLNVHVVIATIVMFYTKIQFQCYLRTGMEIKFTG